MLAERLTYLRDLEARRATIRQAVEEQGKLTDDLARAIAGAETKSALEDLYLPYKRKRRTKAMIARENGLEPLLTAILSDRGADPQALAQGYVSEAVPTVKDALNGARDILAEGLCESAGLLGRLRDFMRAEADLARSAPTAHTEYRSGSGFDVHAFGPGDQVTICGVSIPFDRGFLAHSDGDVGMHALTDAIFGALAEGDIGRWFPPSDPQWKGADSAIFLAKAAERVAARGGRIVNVDVTLICEAPKIGPHSDLMRRRPAEILRIDLGRVSVKATTTERLGFPGRGEGIAAQAAASLALPCAPPADDRSDDERAYAMNGVPT